MGLDFSQKLEIISTKENIQRTIESDIIKDSKKINIKDDDLKKTISIIKKDLHSSNLNLDNFERIVKNINKENYFNSENRLCEYIYHQIERKKKYDENILDSLLNKFIIIRNAEDSNELSNTQKLYLWAYFLKECSDKKIPYLDNEQYSKFLKKNMSAEDFLDVILNNVFFKNDLNEIRKKTIYQFNEFINARKYDTLNISKQYSYAFQKRMIELFQNLKNNEGNLLEIFISSKKGTNYKSQDFLEKNFEIQCDSNKILEYKILIDIEEAKKCINKKEKFIFIPNQDKITDKLINDFALKNKIKNIKILEKYPDCCFFNGKTLIVCESKYLNEQGGIQNFQFKDLIKVSQINEKNLVGIGILSGELQKLKSFKEEIGNNRIFTLTTLFSNFNSLIDELRLDLDYSIDLRKTKNQKNM